MALFIIISIDPEIMCHVIANDLMAIIYLMIISCALKKIFNFFKGKSLIELSKMNLFFL